MSDIFDKQGFHAVSDSDSMNQDVNPVQANGNPDNSNPVNQAAAERQAFNNQMNQAGSMPQYTQQGDAAQSQYTRQGGAAQSQYAQQGNVVQSQYAQQGGAAQSQYTQQGGAAQSQYTQQGGAAQSQYTQQGGVAQYQYTQGQMGRPEGSAQMGPSPHEYQSGYHQNSQQQYQSSQPGGEPGKKPAEALAIAGMICGICSILFLCVGPLAILLGIAGLICSLFALKKKQSKGMYLTGIITSGFGIVIGIIVTSIFLFVGIKLIGSGSSILEQFRNSLNNGSYSQNYNGGTYSLPDNYMDQYY